MMPLRPLGARHVRKCSAKMLKVLIFPVAQRGNRPEDRIRWLSASPRHDATAKSRNSSGLSSESALMAFLRKLAVFASAMLLSREAKNSLSLICSVSHGGLPSIAEKPPVQPVAVLEGPSSGTSKMLGNSRCQWKSR